nr:class I SAM-dependent methyltransferase [Chloroflexota bacterium]
MNNAIHAMYDDLSTDYDRFVNWTVRLAMEMPFIEQELRRVEAHRVLDVACGTGMHGIALSQRGYDVVGADVSPRMIAQAQANAAAADVAARFVVAGFGELRTKVGSGFDALLCLGNSLPHLLTAGALETTLVDFASCLRFGGLLLIQNRNFDRVLARRERWQEPQAHREGEQEWLFLRFYDFEPDGTLTFNLVTLRRKGAGKWEQRLAATRLWPQRRDELVAALQSTGFSKITCWGDMQGHPFDPESSSNLVIEGRRE